LLNEITKLRDELRTALGKQQTSMFFQIKGKRIEFEDSIKKAHKRLKANFFHWLVTGPSTKLDYWPYLFTP